MTYKEIVSELSKPLPYQWRVQSRNKDKTKAICTAYIDARDCMNRLDEIGLPWDTSAEEIGGFIFCTVSIMTDDHYVSKTDCGARVEDNAQDQMYEQAGKSAYSDAFKRACVQWGLGRFLYDMPAVTLPCDQYGNVVDDTGARVWDLTKHINNLQAKGKKAAPAKAQPVKETATSEPLVVESPEPTEPVAGEQVPLPQDKLDAMLKYIQEGKVAEVETAMKKYKLTAAQRTVLAASIKQAKK